MKKSPEQTGRIREREIRSDPDNASIPGIAPRFGRREGVNWPANKVIKNAIKGKSGIAAIRSNGSMITTSMSLLW